VTSTRATRPLSLGAALAPVIAMLVFYTAGVLTLGSGGELLVAVLLASAGVAGVVAVRQGHSWDDIQRATGEKLASVLPVVLILLAIGTLIGSWVLSGTIPFLVYWGIQLINPQYLVLTAFLATVMMSSFTGTSWGSAGTMGVAFMATAAALDAPLAATAGAVISGAYFGDKMSPLSDSTIICSMAAEAPLFLHIRHMLYTAVPSFVMCLILYTLAAQLMPASGGGLPGSARAVLADIAAAYQLHWLVMLPPIVVTVCIVSRVPAALAIMLSSLVAVAIGITLQGFAARDGLMAAVAGFRVDMLSSVGVDPAGVSADFRTLVQRGGLYSMATTLIVIISAFLLAGAMEVSGSLNLLIERLLRSVRSVFGLIASTMAAGATMIGLTSHGGVTALVIGGLFQKAYRDRGLAPENLSRSLEDSITITEPLMPWTVSGVFMATTVGVPTLQYAPWAVFCYGGPIFSLLLAGLYSRTNFGLKPLGSGTE
jgi:NhaC family Na+:H+ antiporter